VVLLAACAGPNGGATPSPPATEPVPVLPPDALPGYVVNRATLDADALALDALDPEPLRSLLEEAGFETGSETRFTAHGKRLTRVVARVLRFPSPEGAAEYLGWLGSHPADLLGSKAEGARAPDLPEAIAYRYEPCADCHNDTAWYFAAWARGPYVLTLRIGGPAAGGKTAAPLASELDAVVAGSG
jgi:hypothetical protein